MGLCFQRDLQLGPKQDPELVELVTPSSPLSASPGQPKHYTCLLLLIQGERPKAAQWMRLGRGKCSWDYWRSESQQESTSHLRRGNKQATGTHTYMLTNSQLHDGNSTDKGSLMHSCRWLMTCSVRHNPHSNRLIAWCNQYKIDIKLMSNTRLLMILNSRIFQPVSLCYIEQHQQFVFAHQLAISSPPQLRASTTTI